MEKTQILTEEEISQLAIDLSKKETRKEMLQDKLDILKVNKDIKNTVINRVVEKVLGTGKISGYAKFALKTYLLYKYGI